MNTLYGLLGQSLVHSMSPIIHKAIFDKVGLSASYHLLEVEKYKLKDKVKQLELNGAIGVNVTIPYKIEVMEYLGELSPEAAAIGAVNCIAFSEHGTIGYNTDYFGFGMMLEKYNIKINNRNALVLGYGGAAKSVIRYLLDHGIASIVIAVRNINIAPSNVTPQESRKINLVSFEHIAVQNEGDLIINCTPCGMYPNINEVPVAADIYAKCNTAVDLIYNPIETLFLKQAGEAGLKTVNGMYMLVSQAVAAQEIWNDVHLSTTDIEEVYKIVIEYLLQQKK